MLQNLSVNKKLSRNLSVSKKFVYLNKICNKNFLVVEILNIISQNLSNIFEKFVGL